MFRASRRARMASEKPACLRAFIDAEGDKCTNAIIFCNRKVDVDILSKSLKKHGYNAEAIHGDLDQSQRTRTLDAFRAGELRFLVASDVAARGLDIPAVSHVFNYDVPSHSEDYVHRIGRTGRAGRDGKAVMICTPADEKNLGFIEKLIEKAIPRAENPVQQTAAPADAERPDKPEAAHDEPRKRGRGAGRSKSDAKPERGRNDKPDARSERGRGGRRDDKVVGMGDHMPAFLAMSFEDRRTG